MIMKEDDELVDDCGGISVSTLQFIGGMLHSTPPDFIPGFLVMVMQKIVIMLNFCIVWLTANNARL